MILIESENNKIVKYIKSLDTKKGRDKHNRFIIEGKKYVDSIPDEWQVESYVISQSMNQKIDVNEYSSRAQIYVLKDSIFNSVSDTVTPQGIFAICNKLEYHIGDILNKSQPLFILMIEEIIDPGNLGTIIRTAESAGACGIIVSKNSVDIYNKKVLRSTAGAIFSIPVIENAVLADFCDMLKGKGIKIIATHLKGATYPYDMNLSEDCAIIVGNEARGISEEIIKNVNCTVKIPMIGDSDSLNVSVASGILIYEVVRQRLKKYKI